MLRIAHFVTHPIQYFAPLYRALAESADVDLTVYFGSDFGTRLSFDPGLGREVQFDIPLLEGFRFEFLKNNGDGKPSGDWTSFDCPDLQSFLSGRNFDIVWIHGWGYRFQRQAAMAAESLGIPYVIRGESTLVEAPFLSLRWIRRFALHHRIIRRAAACLYVGAENKKFYRSFGIVSARLLPALYSIDVEFFARSRLSEVDRDQYRRNRGLDEKAVVVVTIAKLISRKRVADLVAAVALCPRNVHLWVLGDGEQAEALKELATRIAPDRVIWFGFTNQQAIPGILSAADVFALASDEETWGLVVNEAMACGLPAIVSTKVGCAEDLIFGGETGVRYPCGDVDALAVAISQMTSNKTSLARMKTSAFQHVESNYSSKATARQLVTAFQKVAKSS